MRSYDDELGRASVPRAPIPARLLVIGALLALAGIGTYGAVGAWSQGETGAAVVNTVWAVLSVAGAVAMFVRHRRKAREKPAAGRRA